MGGSCLLCGQRLVLCDCTPTACLPRHPIQLTKHLRCDVSLKLLAAAPGVRSHLVINTPPPFPPLRPLSATFGCCCWPPWRGPTVGGGGGFACPLPFGKAPRVTHVCQCTPDAISNATVHDRGHSLPEGQGPATRAHCGATCHLPTNKQMYERAINNGPSPGILGGGGRFGENGMAPVTGAPDRPTKGTPTVTRCYSGKKNYTNYNIHTPTYTSQR